MVYSLKHNINKIYWASIALFVLYHTVFTHQSYADTGVVSAEEIASSSFSQAQEKSTNVTNLTSSTASLTMEEQLKLLKQELESHQQTTTHLVGEITKLEAKIESQNNKSAKVDDLMERIQPYISFGIRYDTRHFQGNRAVDRPGISLKSGIIYSLTDEINIGYGILMGVQNPTASYLTFGEGFAHKPVYTDTAFIEYNPHKLPEVKITAGKMFNPFYFNADTQFIWDTDVHPEGAVVHYNQKFKNVEMTTTLGEFLVESRSQASDTYLFGGQGIAKYKTPKSKTALVIGTSYYDFANVRGNTPVYDRTNSFGNSRDPLGRYTKDYNLVELFGEVKQYLHTIPVSLFGNYLMNTGANEENLAWIGGISAGKLHHTHSIRAFYDYRYVQKDSMIGIFPEGGNSSEFRVGVQGHRFGVEYMPIRNISVRLMYYIEEMLEPTSRNLNRFRIDLRYKL